MQPARSGGRPGGTGLARHGCGPRPGGPAWIVRLMGYHYHNTGRKDQVGAEFVRSTLINALRTKTIKLSPRRRHRRARGRVDEGPGHHVSGARQAAVAV